jgi:capsular polysaccharide transport system ATP-binding protein
MKLEFVNVSKISNRKQQVYDLHEANFSFTERQSIALLSTYGRSATAFLNLISGIDQPTKGIIQRDGTFTGPIGEPSYFHRELSGEENIRFICKIYGQNSNQVLKKVCEFSGLRKELKQKTKNYSPVLKRKISISASLMMKSDIYQLSGALNHPEPEFNTKIQMKLGEIAKNTTFIISAGDTSLLTKYAETAIVIDGSGQLKTFSNVQEGIEALKKGY